MFPPHFVAFVLCHTLFVTAAEPRSRESSKAKPSDERSIEEIAHEQRTHPEIPHGTALDNKNPFELKKGPLANNSTTEIGAGENKNDPHAILTPEQRQRAMELSERISTVARTLVRDASMAVTPGDWWAYWFAEGSNRHKITYPIHDMLGHSDKYAMGVIGHEISHALHSRIPSKVDNNAFHFLWNAIEDIRINKIISERFAGMPAMLREAYSEWIPKHDKVSAEGKMIRSELFAYGFIYEWATKGKTLSGITDPEVIAAIDEARPYVLETTRLPPGVDLRFDSMNKEEIDFEALRSFEVIRDQIWPIYQRLLEKDMNDPSTKDKADQQQQGEGDGKPGEGKPGEGKPGEGKPGKGEKGGKPGEPSEGNFDESGNIASNQVPRDPLKGKTGIPSLDETREALDKLFKKAADALGGKVQSEADKQVEEAGKTGAKAPRKKGSKGEGEDNISTSGSQVELDYAGDPKYGKLEDQVKALEQKLRDQRNATRSGSPYQAICDKQKKQKDALVTEIANAIERDDLPELVGPLPRFSRVPPCSFSEQGATPHPWCQHPRRRRPPRKS